MARVRLGLELGVGVGIWVGILLWVGVDKVMVRSKAWASVRVRSRTIFMS
jgi:hypothetical protein